MGGGRPARLPTAVIWVPAAGDQHDIVGGEYPAELFMIVSQTARQGTVSAGHVAPPAATGLRTHPSRLPLT